MKKDNNLVFYLAGLAVVVSLVAGVTFAAFTDKAKVLGSNFSIGSADIRFLNNLPMGTDPTNLVDELPGPTFGNIGQTWSSDYPIKIINNGTSGLNITSHAYYETANDPAELRSDISVEIFEWNDANGNGVLDTGEVGLSLGKKTIVKWKTEGLGVGQMYPGQLRALVLRFSTENLSTTKQGKTALFDFEFESAQL
ncbi:hypothetical protein A2380_03380 [candidate division WWE3 bacterium RIFOXYB1_FULL_43_24]|uniref:Camelysin metallo-endopeptidase n=2 Tax=Katanobacteria TaxID=422282 RepID=A0A0G1BIE5_UNCKA|nr:MAG: hypothetical protein UU92_C0012G0007 [candidate division WWE3 bacterium GW2011_GWA1_42_12]KKS34014.1 MAG: hypothetical protein UU97_C0016G0007 [candidate division WWE3 bacterium GW2011_GWD1_42_14]KKS37203.1 MAG: hypothetical protein UV00_C0016G0007 [candidate division WWE3 bacterium GW2011_GWF1_42_14]KKS40064.1 MAG: hypothetical protein UV03_C0013G0007 [candidate division WWE3 bacterium GW2011_GWE1_42_16]KKS66748.1 MAG: hypothetical protein UV35_C0008G0007 [candidate division WWE3 bacte